MLDIYSDNKHINMDEIVCQRVTISVINNNKKSMGIGRECWERQGVAIFKLLGI